MRIFLTILLLCAAASARAEEPTFLLSEALVNPPQLSTADTTSNKTLDDMLSQFMAKPAATQLAFDSWTLTAHRYMGYAIMAATGAQVVLGSITWDERKQGKEPGTLDAHKYLGYSIAGLSVGQSAFGYFNFWKLRDRETGKKKRWFHLTLSTLATAGFVTAAALAYNSRQDIEDGTAALERKTFDDLYGNHRTVAILTTASVLLTATVIIW